MKVKAIRPAGREPVYNLEVPGPRCFSVAGGLIVHNCYDAIRYWCISRPWASAPPDKKKKKGRYGNDDWMG